MSDLVRVEWLDSARLQYGWDDHSVYAQCEPAECVTVGILVAKTKSKLVVVLSQGENHSCLGIVIPRACVTKITYLDGG